MRIPYKAAQLVLYGSGDEVYVATYNGNNRLVVFDSRAVMTLSWRDEINVGAEFSISLNRKEFIECVRKSKPRSGFYFLEVTSQGSVNLFDHNCTSGEPKGDGCFIRMMAYNETDITRFNHLYAGLCVDQKLVSGSVTLDFDQFRSVLDFVHQYISVGKFGKMDARIVNLQTVNENFPLVIQAFVKCDPQILCDLDIACLSFNVERR